MDVSVFILMGLVIGQTFRAPMSRKYNGTRSIRFMDSIRAMTDLKPF